jgi:putative CRISPR-associated protein (TIGR02619 family)
MIERKYVLSPCGTSLLTNGVSPEDRRLLVNFTNVRNSEEVPAQERSRIQNIIDKKKELLEVAGIGEAKKMSAEINGITVLYDNSFANAGGDYHVLLSTDTWLGEETAKLVQMWLEKQNREIIVLPYRQLDLQTENMLLFQLSLSDVIRRLSSEIPVYRKRGYKIFFNLTGGFKSVVGFLQSISSFYADEAVYIFESSNHLMRIPKLPVTMDTVSVVVGNLDSFRRIYLDLPVDDMKNIPEILFFTMEGQTIFSAWGEVIWNDAKSKIYSEKLLPSPMPEKIKYGKSFEKTVASLPDDRIEKINNRVDELSRFVRDKKRNLKSLDFKQLVDAKAMSPSTHEMDAWSDGDARRIYGHYEGEVFILDKLDKALH